MSKKIVRQCLECGKRFEILPSATLRNRGNCCSLRCAGLYRNRGIGYNEHWEVTPTVSCVKLDHDRFALVNTSDLEKITSYRWRLMCVENISYARASKRMSDGKRHHFLMHRLIMDAPKDLEVDHINGNGLDNSDISGRMNLRLATRRQNSQNRHEPKTSRFLGVYWRPDDKIWVAQIMINRKVKYLGSRKVEEEAAELYRRALERLGSEVLA